MRHCYFFAEVNSYYSSHSIYKHDAIDIADPSGMQDSCHKSFKKDLAHLESMWLSGRASECGICRSEVRFLMGTQNFFVLRSRQDVNIFLNVFTELTTYHPSYS